MAKRRNKYDYLYIVQGRYGDTYQWEDFAVATNPREAESLSAWYAGHHRYRSRRTIQRRVLREDSERLRRWFERKRLGG